MVEHKPEHKLMGPPHKAQIVERLIQRVHGELIALQQAARSAHDAATNEESRAEDPHDTRGIEASYLAGAQSGRALVLQQLLVSYRLMDVRSRAPDAPVTLGALVELLEEASNRKLWVLLVPREGGQQIDFEGVSVQVIGPKSPIGEGLLGRRAGELFDVEANGAVREFEVLRVL